MRGLLTLDLAGSLMAVQGATQEARKDLRERETTGESAGWPSTYGGKVWKPAGLPSTGYACGKEALLLSNCARTISIYTCICILYIRTYICIRTYAYLCVADERTPRIYDWLTGGRSGSVPGNQSLDFKSGSRRPKDC